MPQTFTTPSNTTDILFIVSRTDNATLPLENLASYSIRESTTESGYTSNNTFRTVTQVTDSVLSINKA